MKILISNDDGIQASGIHALAQAFCGEHEVTVVAPDSERSACSHSLTSMYKISYKKEEGYPYAAYSCSGTPADCVKLGVFELKAKPDLILSGINHGTNLGSDVMYSGTVSAAFEGIYLGIPAIAVSASSKASIEKLKEVAKFIKDNFQRFLDLKLPITSALSINYPLHKPIAGVKITKLGIHEYIDEFFPIGDGLYQLQGSPRPLNEWEKDCDVHWFDEGYVTLTPIQNDRNDYPTLKRIEGDFK